MKELPYGFAEFRNLMPNFVIHKDTKGIHRVQRVRGDMEKLTYLPINNFAILPRETEYDVKIEHESDVYNFGRYSYKELREHYRLRE